MILTLPYPPALNRYYRHDRGSTHLSETGRSYREAVLVAVIDAGITERLDGWLVVTITLHLPDRRKRDTDGALKALLDALQYAEVFEDDYQVEELHVFRRREPTVSGGKVVVEIAHLKGTA